MPEKVLELMNDLEAWWEDTDAQFLLPIQIWIEPNRSGTQISTTN